MIIKMRINYGSFRDAFDAGDYERAMVIACENPEAMKRVTLLESYRLKIEAEARMEERGIGL